MLKLENKQKCNSHTCWQWDFVKIMIQQNFPPTVAWQQSRQSTVGDEVEQVFLLRRRWSFNCPPLTICPKVDTTLLITVKLLLLLQPNNSNILFMRRHNSCWTRYWTCMLTTEDPMGRHHERTRFRKFHIFCPYDILSSRPWDFHSKLQY